MRIVSTVAVAALELTFALSCAAVMGQDAPGKPAASAADRVLARLKAACESDSKLRGALLSGGAVRDGVLALSGTVDHAGQVASIEDAGTQLLDASPSWKEQIPGGVSAAKLTVFPIRSDLLKRLQKDFAGPASDPAADAKPDPSEVAGLLKQTRIDDLYFNSQGRPQFDGLCINDRALLAQQGPAAAADLSPSQKITLAILKRLKGYPVPETVDHKILSGVIPKKLTFEQNPVRRLQRLANQKNLDDLFFCDAHFDAKGDLIVDVLLAKEAQLEVAESLIAQPELAKAYARPDQRSQAKAVATLKPLPIRPWRETLRSGLQKRFADDGAGKPGAGILRHCRIDRAFFAYAQDASLKLKFEGVMLSAKGLSNFEVYNSLRVNIPQLFAAPAGVRPAVQSGLTPVANPTRVLQTIVASNPALDGVRIDDVTFGPEGQTTLEGLWIGPAQADALDAAITPALVEQTQKKVNGPLTRQLAETPTDQMLKGLRAKAFKSADETCLLRLFFRPASDADAPHEMLLQGATNAAGLPQVKAQLEEWVKADPIFKVVGAPVVELTPRPKTLLAELRRMVVTKRALDGVRIDHAGFDEENAFVISGRQDHEGQAEAVRALIGKAAALAWKDLPPPETTKEGTFALRPIQTLLATLARELPKYREADGVLLDRAYYNNASELVLGGTMTATTAGADRDKESLTKKIESVLAGEPGIKVGPLDLTRKPINSNAQDRIISDAIIELANGRLASFPLKDLDEAILDNPSESTAWYLRGAYYYIRQDFELATRDLRRAGKMERENNSRGARYGRLEKFQSSQRTEIEKFLDKACEE